MSGGLRSETDHVSLRLRMHFCGRSMSRLCTLMFFTKSASFLLPTFSFERQPICLLPRTRSKYRSKEPVLHISQTFPLWTSYLSKGRRWAAGLTEDGKIFCPVSRVGGVRSMHVTASLRTKTHLRDTKLNDFPPLLLLQCVHNGCPGGGESGRKAPSL